MKNDRRQTILFIIILLVLSMGIGYAFLTTTLSIDGTSDIDSASWDVHFENVQVHNESITGSQVITPATISADGQTVSYHIKLNQPGDGYVFKVDVVNDGSLNAMIDNILFKINGEDATMAPEYLGQYVMYDGFYPIEIGNTLGAGETRTLISAVYYRDDIDSEDLPTEDASLTISFGLVYKQYGTSSYKYSIQGGSYNYAGSLPNGISLHDDSLQLMMENDHGVVLRYLIIDNNIYETSVGFYFGGNIYYLISDNISYNRNKELLNSIYGEEHCYETFSKYICSLQNGDPIVNISTDGDIEVSDGNAYICESNHSNYEYVTGCHPASTS